MAQISEHMNKSNHKIHSYCQISKMIANIGSKKGENNIPPLANCELTRLHISIQMIIVNNPEKCLSNIYGKYDTIKSHKDSVESSTSLLYCLILTMNNRVNHTQKRRLMLKPY